MGFKIVRDRHKERLDGHISGTWRTSPDPVSALIKKLGEEYSELVEGRDPSELYDIADVLDELRRLMDPDGKYAAEHVFKAEHVGRFADHLEWHPLPAGEMTWEQFAEEHGD